MRSWRTFRGGAVLAQARALAMALAMAMATAMAMAMATAPPQPLSAHGPEGDGVRHQRRLLVIGEGPQRRPIVVRVGEVVQFAPVALPLVPPFEDAQAVRFRVKLEGDRVLEEIGQCAAPSDREGRWSPGVFFLVKGAGRTQVELLLTVQGQVATQADKARPRFHQTYLIEADKAAD